MNYIFDNIIFLHQVQGGVSHYWYLLLQEYINNPNAEFLENKSSHLNYYREKLTIPESQILSDRNWANTNLIRLIPKSILPKDQTLVHSSYYRNLNTNSNVKEVTTVHDFVHEKFLKGPRLKIHKQLKYNTIKRSSGIICISQNTYEDLKKYVPLQNQKVVIIPNAISNDFYPIDENPLLRKKYELSEKPQLLFVGGRKGYKNFSFYIELLKSNTEFSGIIVGNALNKEEIKELEGTDYKVFTGISNRDLNEIYHLSFALIYPSLYEGFGMPLVEAMKTKVPFLALRNSSLVEVAGNAGVLFNQADVSKFSQTLQKLKNKDYRTELIGKGEEQSEKYSLEENNRRREEFYKEIMNETE